MGKDLQNVIDLCAKLRNVSLLKHRVIYEFGWFLQRVVEYYVFKRCEIAELCRFLENHRIDTGRIEDYVDLFEKWCIERYSDETTYLRELDEVEELLKHLRG